MNKPTEKSYVFVISQPLYVCRKRIRLNDGIAKRHMNVPNKRIVYFSYFRSRQYARNETAKQLIAKGHDKIISQSGSPVWYFNGSVLQRYGTSTVRHFNGTALQRYGASTVRHFNGSVLQRYGASTVRCFNGTVLQRYGTSMVRQEKPP